MKKVILNLTSLLFICFYIITIVALVSDIVFWHGVFTHYTKIPVYLLMGTSLFLLAISTSPNYRSTQLASLSRLTFLATDIAIPILWLLSLLSLLVSQLIGVDRLFREYQIYAPWVLQTLLQLSLYLTFVYSLQNRVTPIQFRGKLPNLLKIVQSKFSLTQLLKKFPFSKPVLFLMALFFSYIIYLMQVDKKDFSAYAQILCLALVTMYCSFLEDN